MTTIWNQPAARHKVVPFAGLLTLVVSSGALIALGSPLITLMLFGIFGAALLLFIPVNLVLVAVIVTTLLLAGTAEYFGRINQAQWIPFLMALALYARLPLEMLHPHSANRNLSDAQRTPFLYWLIAIYLALVAITAIANQAPVLQTLVGAKGYLFYWSFLFLILNAQLTPRHLDSFWKSIVFIALLQVPVVLYQHFVVMKTRSSMYGFDAVVGTFGGDPSSGGNSSTLLLYALVAALYATALHIEGLLKTGRWLTILLVSGMVIAMGETKIAFVLIPVSFSVIYWERLKRSKSDLLAFAAILGMAITALLAIYQSAYWDDSLRTGSLGDSIEKSITYIVDPDNMTRETGEVGRMAALNLWLQDPMADGIRRTIGYGPGASRGRSTVSIGVVAQRYAPYAIDTSSAAALLWDMGILGLICFSAVLVSGAWLAYRTAKRVAPNTPQRAGLRTASATLICMLLMMAYNKSVVDLAPEQLLMVFCLAYAAFWHRAPNTTRDDR